MQVDINDRKFICRFWIAYWQGRLLLLEAFESKNGQVHWR